MILKVVWSRSDAFNIINKSGKWGFAGGGVLPGVVLICDGWVFCPGIYRIKIDKIDPG